MNLIEVFTLEVAEGDVCFLNVVRAHDVNFYGVLRGNKSLLTIGFFKRWMVLGSTFNLSDLYELVYCYVW